jgi:DNA anti-recombination protein RmuC
MAILAVAALALFVVLLNSWINRNSNSTVMKVLATANEQKDKDIQDLKAQRDQENRHHNERMEVLRVQVERTNDLSEQANNILATINAHGVERDSIQKQVAEDIHTMVSSGSLPVQEILARVRTFTDVLTRIDTRTADWNAIMIVIQPLMLELGALRAEAKKHATQPIPAIEPPPTDGGMNPL